MLKLSRTQLKETLLAIGLKSADGLLVHSAVQFLGLPAEGIQMYLEVLREILGPEGTIAVPAFNFAFARSEPYHKQETPAEGMGIFSEFVRQHPEALRTTHPMQSLAIIGRHAADLANMDTLSAFDPDSAFEELLKLDFKLLLLGASVYAVSMIHYSEQRAHVPYRYWKTFSGQVFDGVGWETRTYRMFARDLDLDPHLDLTPVQDLLATKGQWLTHKLNYGQVASCRLRNFVAAADQILEKDPWALVTNRPPSP
jgi:aminoglycoside N3'-acetyltransferase